MVQGVICLVSAASLLVAVYCADEIGEMHPLYINGRVFEMKLDEDGALWMLNLVARQRGAVQQWCSGL